MQEIKRCLASLCTLVRCSETNENRESLLAGQDISVSPEIPLLPRTQYINFQYGGSFLQRKPLWIPLQELYKQIQTCYSACLLVVIQRHLTTVNIILTITMAGAVSKWENIVKRRAISAQNMSSSDVYSPYQNKVELKPLENTRPADVIVSITLWPLANDSCTLRTHKHQPSPAAQTSNTSPSPRMKPALRADTANFRLQRIYWVRCRLF